MTTIGATIRKMRIAKGLSVRKLAERSGISHPYLSQIENDKNNPSPTILIKLAKGLQCDYLFLLGLAGYKEVDNMKEYVKTIVDVEQKWNMYHCGLCEVEFAVNYHTDFGETSCPKCESGEATYLLRTEVIGRNNHFIGFVGAD